MLHRDASKQDLNAWLLSNKDELLAKYYSGPIPTKKDPVQDIQEQLLKSLITIRDGFNNTLLAATQEVENAKGKVNDQNEVDHLRAENKKLNYRVIHLLRTIEEIEA